MDAFVAHRASKGVGPGLVPNVAPRTRMSRPSRLGRARRFRSQRALIAALTPTPPSRSSSQKGDGIRDKESRQAWVGRGAAW
jgi:hypothetical protein